MNSQLKGPSNREGMARSWNLGIASLKWGMSLFLLSGMGWAAIPEPSTSDQRSKGQSEEIVHALSTNIEVLKSGTSPKLSKSFGRFPLSFEVNQGQVDEQVKYLARGKGYTLFLTETEAVLSLRSAASEKGEVRREKEIREALGVNSEGQESEKGEERREQEEREASEVKGEGGNLSLPFVRGLNSEEGLNGGVEGRDERTGSTFVVRMKFVGANQTSKVSGNDKLPGIVNYFIGNDPEKWHTKIPTYKNVKYDNLYEGIDLVYYGNQGQLEYDLVVAPGADPSQIHLAFDGTGDITVDPTTGDLVLSLPGLSSPQVGSGDPSDSLPFVRGEERGVESSEIPSTAPFTSTTLRLLKPHVYQMVDGKKVEVEATYRVGAVSEPGFNSLGSSTHHASLFTAGEVSESVDILLAAYDRTKPLIIDPILDWSTYLGTPAIEEIFGVAVDSAGAVYVTGFTTTSGFPGTSGSLIQPDPAGGSDAFVAKMNPTGTAIDYATYLGTAPGGDAGHGIAVDAAGAAYVTGITNGAGFPGTSGSLIQPGFGGGNSDAFVAKLNPTGTAIDYATYLGTAGVDGGLGIAVDGAGAAYAIGQTNGAGFPGTSGSLIQPALQGIFDAFVAKINSAGTAIDYATYLGTSGDDRGEAIAVNAAGEAYVTGSTSASGFPGVSVGSIQPAHAGGSDAFVAKLDGGGTAVEYATYLGTTGFDVGWGITSDAAGAAYVVGETSGTGFPGTSGSLIQSGFAGGFRDAFVVKLAPAGDLIQYGTYLGTTGDDRGRAIAVNAMGAVSVTGQTDGVSFPGTVGSTIQDTNAGDVDGFIVKLTRAGDAIDYATYLGTVGADLLWSIALDAAGAGYVSGEAGGSFLPGTSPSSIQPTYFANQDGLVSKICDDPPLGVSSGTWTATAGNLTEARARSTSTLLPDGRVLIAGGGTDINSLSPQSTNSANLYDPSTGLFTATGSGLSSRFDHTATLLASGQVLIAGGEGVGGGATTIHASAVLYNPSTGLFSATTGTLGTPRSRHTATLLADGSVLLVGGNGGGAGTAEIYNPSTGLFSPTTGLLVDLRVDHTATRLADGRVLIIGGSQDGALRTAEIFDPGTGLFTATGEMTERRFDHSATLLSDGRVLVAGGLNELLSGPPDTAEIYDPETGTFGPILPLTTIQTDHTASLLHDGRVLLAGGLAMETVEFYDPTLGTFIRTGDFVEAERRASSATVLANGQVLMTGGSVWSNTDTLLSTAELYTPNLCGLEAENTSPVADDQTIPTFLEDPTSPVVITLTASDADSATLTFEHTNPPPAGGPLHGDLSAITNVVCTPDGSGGSTCTAEVTYTPDPDYNNDIDGSDSFTFAVQDDDASDPLTSADATVTLNITSVNDVPEFSISDDTVEVDENSGATTLPGWATDIRPGPVTATDEVGQTLEFEITGNTNPSLFSVLPTVDPVTGNLQFTPATNVDGVTTLSLVLSDDGGTANGGVDTTDALSFTITVNDDVPPPPHDLVFDVNGGAINPNTWLPTPGTVLTVRGIVRRDGVSIEESDPSVPQPNITFEVMEVTEEPGAYTNDPNTDPTVDFTFSTDDLDNGDRTLTVTAEDYGGRIRIHATTEQFDDGSGDGTMIFREADLILPLDAEHLDEDGLPDGDGIADAWEVAHGGTDLDGEVLDPGPMGGPALDGLTAKQKYRGFKWGPPMVRLDQVGNPEGTPETLYQTPAWVPDPAVNLSNGDPYDPPHFRGDPTRQDLFVEVTHYDFGNMYNEDCDYDDAIEATDCEAPFAIGDAFHAAGIDVHVRSTDVPRADVDPDAILDHHIDAVAMENREWINPPTNSHANRLAQDGLLGRDGARLWSYDRKGESCVGDEDEYAVNAEGGMVPCSSQYTETYQIPLDHYYEDRPYGNGVTFTGPDSPDDAPFMSQLASVDEPNPPVLDPRARVKDPRVDPDPDDDDYPNSPNVDDRSILAPGVPCEEEVPNRANYGDYWVNSNGNPCFGMALSAENINNNNFIEFGSGTLETPGCEGVCGVPDVPDHPDIPSFEATRPQVLKRTITHELGHAVGIPHLSEADECLMRAESRSWRNDNTFCSIAQTEIDIHND